MLAPRLVLEERRRFGKGLVCIEIKGGGLRTRPHPDNLPTCEKKRPREW